jgi:hypothetical protein
MKDYYKLILNEFIEIYERRSLYNKRKDTIRAVQVIPEKKFKEYADRYNYESYRDINVAIEKIVREGIAEVISDSTGKYTKIRFVIEKAETVYRTLGRIPIPELCENMKKVIYKYQENGENIYTKFCNDQLKLLGQFKKLPYEINYNNKRLERVLKTLQAILKLKQETYIRNFSTALFKDSKEFQKNIRSTIQNILYDYSDVVVEKERILEVYNLFNNPTYVMIKGNAEICYNKSHIHLQEIKGGIAIPNSALAEILLFIVNADKVITVENLTTYHDTNENQGVIIYLGGYHNIVKQQLLKLIFSKNQHKNYFHKGDLDVYGFCILENLKLKTGIHFEPLEMDIATLKRFYDCGLYKHLTSADRKAMEAENLQIYEDVFKFMIEHDCKVEQESVKAVELINEN